MTELDIARNAAAWAGTASALAYADAVIDFADWLATTTPPPPALRGPHIHGRRTGSSESTTPGSTPTEGEVMTVITRAQVDALTDEDYERGRKAVEDVLIEMRDERISLPFRNNGLCVKESDGTPSDVIRLAITDALRIGMRAIADEATR